MDRQTQRPILMPPFYRGGGIIIIITIIVFLRLPTWVSELELNHCQVHPAPEWLWTGAAWNHLLQSATFVSLSGNQCACYMCLLRPTLYIIDDLSVCVCVCVCVCVQVCLSAGLCPE